MMHPNDQIASRLEEVAALLEQDHANPYRVDAYRRGAWSIRGLKEPISSTFAREGLEGLSKIPGIGDHLAFAIRSLILTGRLPMLEHLRGEADPAEILMSVPWIGRVQAKRLYEELGIHTLEDLEAAAHDGRLEGIAGLGKKRVGSIIDSLASRLGRVRDPRTESSEPEPSIGELLDVDREYRELASADALRRIAPRRFNPSHEAWLPILHTDRGDHHYTALYSNTARAHELGRTHDWVILYYDGPRGGRHYTVVTAHQGALKGQRVVRGREAECAGLRLPGEIEQKAS